MAAISFGGLASGLDTNAIITGLMNAERAPLRQLQKKQTDTKGQIGVAQNIENKLRTLQSKVEALSKLGRVSALKATSAAADTVAVTAGPGAGSGSYTITDVVLARAQKTRSESFAQMTDAVGTGTLTITQGEKSFAIILDASNATVEGLVSAINSQADLAVTASLFYDGSRYRVLLGSDGTGTDQAFTVDESGLAGPRPGFDRAENLVEEARPASFRLDGQPVTSQTNTVSGVLPGLTFTLQKPLSGSSIEVKVEPDADAVLARVRELVGAYNDAVSAIQAQFQLSGGSAPSSGLFGDSTLRGIAQRLSTVVTSAVNGLPEGSATLGDVGISLDRYGKLGLDESKLRAAVASDLRAVARIFVDDDPTSPGERGVLATLASEIGTFVDSRSGLLRAKITGLNARLEDLGRRVDEMERRLTAREDSLRAQFTTLERVMSQLQAQSAFLTQRLSGR
jgi:flagellar hook-associated protein 2